MRIGNSFRERGLAVLLCIALILAACGLSAPTPSPTPPGPPDPRGVYIVARWNKSPETKIWQDPCVDGVVIRTYWKDLEPSQGQPDWTFLDQQFDQAERSGKKIHLIVAPGFWSPDWALAQVPTAEFEVRTGPQRGYRGRLPIPWSEAYLNLWLDFVNALGQRYRTRPLAIVSATGPTAQNGEMRLPIQREDEQQWKSLGYTQEKIEQAWFRTLDGFDGAFGGAHFTVALFQAPAIPDEAAGTQVLEDVVAYGAAHYPGAFGVQANGLDARKIEPHFNWELVAGHGGALLTGFMMSAAATLHPEQMGDSDPARALRSAVDRGLAKNVDFLEIYEADALNPATRATICYAHQQLAP